VQDVESTRFATVKETAFHFTGEDITMEGEERQEERGIVDPHQDHRHTQDPQEHQHQEEREDIHPHQDHQDHHCHPDFLKLLAVLKASSINLRGHFSVCPNGLSS